MNVPEVDPVSDDQDEQEDRRTEPVKRMTVDDRVERFWFVIYIVGILLIIGYAFKTRLL